MATFYVLRLATAGLNPVWSGDVGYYSLGINLGQQDLITHMGSSMGLASPWRVSSSSWRGDSTFYHAVLPHPIDISTRSIPISIVVMDNAYTAMTGGQPSPSKSVPIERITEALGSPTFVIDPSTLRSLWRW